MTVRVKICGVTRVEDARAAAEAGASAVGLVLWPDSPRFVSIGRARDISRSLDGLDVARVGVFVNQPPEFVAAAARDAALDAIQLHGEEEPGEYDLGLPILRAFTVHPAWNPDVLRAAPPHVLPILDARDDMRRGGTGVTIDWTVAARVAAARAIVLAGGLTPRNVATAVRTVRPFAVDVSSGVESAPGIKDAALIREFCTAVVDTAGPIPRGLRA